MKLRAWFKKFRLQSTPLEGNERRPDNVDALTTMTGSEYADLGGFGPGSAPTNWVPSQQDDKPRH